MIWIAIALALGIWLAGLVLRVGAWANVLLVAAAVMLVYQLLTDGGGGARDR